MQGMERRNQQWVDDLGARNEQAIGDLRVVLLRNLRRALAGRSRADAAFLEDSVQDSLLRILEKLEQFAGRSRFTTWATSIAVHVALGELRRSRWQDVSLDSLREDAPGSSFQIADPTPATDAGEVRQGLLQSLQEAVESELTERQRFALVAELKGAPQEKIAAELGSNRNAVYKLTHDARKKLRRRLEAAGFSAEDIVDWNH